MKEFNISDNLRSSAFLTVKCEDKVNTMTIGWGFEGVIWQKNVFVILIKDMHYTYELMENTDFFTVSFPEKGAKKEALAYFGSNSGRKINKYESGLIDLLEASSVDGYIVEGCIKNYECKILYRQKLLKELFLTDIKQENLHSDGDLHTMIIGEIISSY